MADNKKYIQTQPFKLAGGGISLSDTEIKLQSFKFIDGTPITMSHIGSIGEGTLEPGQEREEIASFTGVTQNADGTAVLTGVTRGLKPYEPYDQDTSLKRSHGGGTTFILTNNPQFYASFANKKNDETIEGQWEFPTPTNPNSTATKSYVDSLAIAGAGDASTSSKGLTRLSQSPNVTKGTATITIASPAVVTFAAHGLTLNDTVRFTTTGALPTGINAGVDYYVMASGLTTDTFRITTTFNGASAVATSGTQSGTHTLIRTTPVAIADNDTRIISSLERANIPTSGEKEALSGTQGTPSTTNKYVTQDNVYTSDTDQSQTTQNAFIEVGEANTITKRNKIAQSFLPTKSKLRGVTLWKTSNTGTFTGTVTVSIQADTSGSPSGTTLSSVTIPNATYLLIANGNFEVIFSSEITLATSNPYWIVIETSTSDTSNHPNIGTNSAGGYTNGSVKTWNTTDGWTTVSTVDLYFKTLQGYSNQISYQNTSPTIKVHTTSGNYVKPAGLKYVVIELQGGGAGGAGTSGDGSNGGTSTFKGLSTGTAEGGRQMSGVIGFSALGGVASGGDLNLTGGRGQAGMNPGNGGSGGNSFFGQGGACMSGSPVAPTAYGAGGAGYYLNSGSVAHGGGGAGGYARKIYLASELDVVTPFTIGAGGASGAGTPGGAGANGVLVATEYYI